MTQPQTEIVPTTHLSLLCRALQSSCIFLYPQPHVLTKHLTESIKFWRAFTWLVSTTGVKVILLKSQYCCSLALWLIRYLPSLGQLKKQLSLDILCVLHLGHTGKGRLACMSWFVLCYILDLLFTILLVPYLHKGTKCTFQDVKIKWDVDCTVFSMFSLEMEDIFCSTIMCYCWPIPWVTLYSC